MMLFAVISNKIFFQFYNIQRARESLAHYIYWQTAKNFVFCQSATAAAASGFWMRQMRHVSPKNLKHRAATSDLSLYL